MKLKLFRYTVEGQGELPHDMLRYDSAWPEQETDAALLAHHQRQYRVITILGLRTPTVERWQSFGWTVNVPAERVVRER